MRNDIFPSKPTLSSIPDFHLQNCHSSGPTNQRPLRQQRLSPLPPLAAHFTAPMSLESLCSSPDPSLSTSVHTCISSHLRYTCSSNVSRRPNPASRLTSPGAAYIFFFFLATLGPELLLLINEIDQSCGSSQSCSKLSYPPHPAGVPDFFSLTSLTCTWVHNKRLGEISEDTIR